jgi:hypothetical protein
MSRQHRVATFFLSLLAGPVLAHSELPRAQWCEGGDPREVASFDFGPEALTPRPPPRPGSGSDSCPSAGAGADGKNISAKDCGQFDDDYRSASNVGAYYCHNFQRVRRRGEIADAGSVVVIVTAPETFLRPTTHHADYSVTQGLEGVCVRCESLRVLPIDPLDSAQAKSAH